MKLPRLKTWQIAVGGLVVFAILFLIGITVAHTLISTTHRPLTVLPIEPVPSQVDGVAGPAIHNGEPVITTSHKCNHTSRTITSHSVKTWQSVNPLGTNIARDNGLQFYKPGCADLRYSNPMPPEVKVYNDTAFSRGAQAVRWTVTAIETPQGSNITAVSWTSEVFVVVP